MSRGSVMVASPGTLDTRLVCAYCALTSGDQPSAASDSAAATVADCLRERRGGWWWWRRRRRWRRWRWGRWGRRWRWRRRRRDGRDDRPRVQPGRERNRGQAVRAGDRAAEVVPLARERDRRLCRELDRLFLSQV